MVYRENIRPPKSAVSIRVHYSLLINPITAKQGFGGNYANGSFNRRIIINDCEKIFPLFSPKYPSAVLIKLRGTNMLDELVAVFPYVVWRQKISKRSHFFTDIHKRHLS